MSLHQIDTARARVLADTVMAWDRAVGDAVSLIAEAETLSDLPAGVTLQLDDIAADGRTMSVALYTAADEADGFEVDLYDGDIAYGYSFVRLDGGGGSADDLDPETPRQTHAELIETLIEPFIEAGYDSEQATEIVTRALEALELGEAVTYEEALTIALAEHSGMSIEEYQRFVAAFELDPGEVTAVLAENFDTVASLSGDGDRIDITDLQMAATDPTLPPEVRAAATRLASDGDLFRNVDVAKQTNVQDGLYANHLDIAQEDGDISLDDLEQFPLKYWQVTTIGPWSILLDTANSGYNVESADREVSGSDVEAFLADPNIPDHVKAAVRSVYLGDDSDIADAITEQHAAGIGVVAIPGLFGPGIFAPPVAAPPVGAPPVTAPQVRAPNPYAAAALAGWTLGTLAGPTIRDWVYDSPEPPDTIQFDGPDGTSYSVPTSDFADIPPDQLAEFIAALQAEAAIGANLPLTPPSFPLAPEQLLPTLVPGFIESLPAGVDLPDLSIVHATDVPVGEQDRWEELEHAPEAPLEAEIDDIVGHAWPLHQREFPEATTEEEFREAIEDVIDNATDWGVRDDGSVYWYDEVTNTLVIKNPAGGGGTAYRPR